MSSPNPNDSITRAELIYELVLRATRNNYGVAFNGVSSGTTLANAVVDTVLNNKNRRPDRYQGYKLSTDLDQPYFPGEKITLAELEAAFTRKHFADFTSPIHVAKLWDDIRIHREGFETDDIVRSNTGAVFALQQSGRWRNFTDDNFVNYDTPARPLVKIGKAS